MMREGDDDNEEEDDVDAELEGPEPEGIHIEEVAIPPPHHYFTHLFPMR